jgi:hypothetical protein
MATISITEEKKKHVINLIKSYRAIDGAIQPYNVKNYVPNISRING